MKSSVLSENVYADKMTSIDFCITSNQVPDKDLTIGFHTQQTVNRLQEKGDISDTQKRNSLVLQENFLCLQPRTYLNGVLSTNNC